MAALVQGMISVLVSRSFSEKLGWDKDFINQIRCFGPDTTDPNMVVDMRKGV